MANSGGPGASRDLNASDGIKAPIDYNTLKLMRDMGRGEVYTHIIPGNTPTEMVDEKKKEDKPSQAAQPARPSHVTLLYQHRYYLWQLLNGATVEQLNCGDERAKQLSIQAWTDFIVRGHPGRTGGRSAPCSITDPNEQELFNSVYKFYCGLPEQETNFQNWYNLEQKVAKNRFLSD